MGDGDVGHRFQARHEGCFFEKAFRIILSVGEALGETISAPSFDPGD
jgi:hypothetical protein